MAITLRYAMLSPRLILFRHTPLLLFMLIADMRWLPWLRFMPLRCHYSRHMEFADAAMLMLICFHAIIFDAAMPDTPFRCPDDGVTPLLL